MSTRYVSRQFPSVFKTIGIDLSPHMLAVASLRDEQETDSSKRVWIHGKGEDTKMADNSVDVVSLAFVIHECPESATDALMKEALSHLGVRVGRSL